MKYWPLITTVLVACLFAACDQSEEALQEPAETSSEPYIDRDMSEEYPMDESPMDAPPADVVPPDEEPTDSETNEGDVTTEEDGIMEEDEVIEEDDPLPGPGGQL